MRKGNVMQPQTQQGDITTNQKVRTNYFQPEFGATRIVAWECQVVDSTEISYDIIFSRDLLT